MCCSCFLGISYKGQPRILPGIIIIYDFYMCSHIFPENMIYFPQKIWKGAISCVGKVIAVWGNI